ncbi:WW/Rsp5/WWP [Penicillium lividum]|nr:WW/Rsp5/WWP [Penicillium lividum]
MLAHGTDSHDLKTAMDSPDLKNGLFSPSRTSEPRQSPTSDSLPTKYEPEVKEESVFMEEKIGDLVKDEIAQPPKLSRSSSKIAPRPPQLFSHLPDSTDDALATFSQIEECWYANKNMGYTEHAMECECAEEWEAESGKNLACGDDSDCINRWTKIECLGDCGCGADCQNQRFQKKQYAPVSVIKTEKKGFGLRAEVNLEPNQLIYEYVGEVVGEAQFRKRMRDYDDQGIKHFYFMSLNKGEFVDATKRGNLGRFCNHSCNPNCYVDKWVVGEKMRMGIFAERAVQAGEELVFNYNVDRYGADPQPCYCAEPNCTGFIGGRTQTERATKLSNATIEALGIDESDGWDTVVARRPKKKKTEEDDEEYVDSVQPKSLDEDGVTKVMAALMQCQEKWIAVKLLGRIQRCEDERVRNRVVKMHGYQILSSQLAMWKEDHNVLRQILDILDTFPRLTRNKIIDSKIEDNIRPITECDDERVAHKATALLASWANLAVGYRIPRMKRGEQAKQAVNQFERRESGREQRARSATRSPSPEHKQNQPKNRREPHNRPPRPNRRNRQQQQPLPDGWYTAKDEAGRTYYYSASKEVTWDRPTAPAPGHPAVNKTNSLLQNIIDGIMNTQEKTPSERKSETPGTPQTSDRPEKKKREVDWWKKLDIQKQKKLYENTLHPHIKAVVDQYKHKIPKEHLKRFAKETAKKLVESDYKRNKVSDPTKISDKHQQTVKSFCTTFFDKAAQKHKERERRKSANPADEDTKMSDDEAEPSGTGTATSPMDDDASSLKRKFYVRMDQDPDHLTPVENGSTSSKRQKSTPPPPSSRDSVESKDDLSPPPPPSPPKFPENGHGHGYEDVEMNEVAPSQIEV